MRSAAVGVGFPHASTHRSVASRHSPLTSGVESAAAGASTQRAAHVRPGGRLVYSTCTLARVENDEVVASFLGRHPDFAREMPSAPCLAGLLDDDGMLRTAPHRGGLDGFFAACLRRA